MLFVCRLVTICFVLSLLVFCGACTHTWRFAKPGPSSRLSSLAIAPSRIAPSHIESSHSDRMEKPSVSPPQSLAPRVTLVGRTLPVGPEQGNVSMTPLPGCPPRSTFPSQVGMQPQAQGWQHAPTRPYVTGNHTLVSEETRPLVYPNYNAGTSPAANNGTMTSPAANNGMMASPAANNGMKANPAANNGMMTSPVANNGTMASVAARKIDNPLRKVPPGRKFGEFISPSTMSGAAPALRSVSNQTVHQTIGPMISPTIGAGIENPSVDGAVPCHEKRSFLSPQCAVGNRYSHPGAVAPTRKGSFFHPRSLLQDVYDDHRNYYTWPNACGYLYAVAGGSLLANTSLDDDFRDWYQRDARSKETDNFAAFWKVFGEGEYIVPLFACTAIAGKALEQFPVADMVGEHGYRTTRAYLVGFPPMLFSQYMLGGSRPNEVPHGSMWRPFNDNNGVSGHSFMGAIPFITAAQMSDHWLAKAGFYTLSTFPAWSRVNDDAHYLSQTCLGWYMAYMACSSVNKTADPTKRRCFEVFPLCQPGGAGIMAVWKR